MVSASVPHVAATLPPVPCHPFLSRAGLLPRLMDPGARLVLLSGPRGCGKSMTLLALARHAVDVGIAVHWCGLQDLGNAPPEGMLLVDDAILPVDPVEQAGLLAQIQARLEGQKVVIALSASQPGLAGPVLHGASARCFGPADLAFDASETAALFQRPEHALEIEHWHHFVEGWPAGVAFGLAERDAALALMRQQGGDRPLPRAMSALFETMIEGCDRDLLMELGVVGHFPARLLQDLPLPPGRPAASRQGFELLLAGGLLLRDCEVRVAWLRFMPAFARFLEDRLKRHDPRRVTDIRGFAATWAATHGDIAAEMRHGLELWSPDETLRRLDQAGALRLSLSEGPDLQIDRPVDVTTVRSRPQAFLSLIYERIRQGAWAEARIHFGNASTLTDGFTSFDTPQDPVVIASWVTVFQSVFMVAEDRPCDPAWRAHLLELRQAAIGRHPVLAMALCTLGVILPLDGGNREEALRESGLGLNLQQTVRTPRAALFVHLHRASALIASARLDEAALAIREASVLAHMDRYADSYEMVSCRIHAGLCAFEEGQQDLAWALLVPCVDRLSRIHGWRRMWAEMFQALALMAHGREGIAAAEHWLDQGQALALIQGLSALGLALDLVRVELRWRGGDAPGAWHRLEQLGDRLSGGTQLAPMIRHQADILRVELLAALGRTDAARAALDLIDAGAVHHCDLRLHLRLEAVTLELEAHPMQDGGPRIDELARLGLRLPSRASAIDLPSRIARLRGEVPATPGPGHVPLSPRESQIMELIIDGLSSKEIARCLTISEGTVKSHRKKIYEKLGVNLRSQAISRARGLRGA